LANQIAVNSAEVDAVVPFYGRHPASGDVAKIRAPLLLHYAGLDERINAGIPEYERALKEAGVNYTIYMYEGANHAFNNDTRKRVTIAATRLAGRVISSSAPVGSKARSAFRASARLRAQQAQPAAASSVQRSGGARCDGASGSGNG
jgi:dienelactone hydrolase